MKAARTVLFWCHLIVGVLVATVVVLMSATGVLLTYQKQMQYWADTRGLESGAPTVATARLDADSLLARVQASTGTAPTSITVRSVAEAPVEVALGREKKVFVNAYTGAVLGEGSQSMRDFFRSVTAWHRTIGATGEKRALGRSITGFANAGFFFIVLSGLVLWWPKAWTRVRLRNITMFRGGLSGKARDFNWHNTIGVWSFLPLVAIVGSGVVMSYPWANALVYRVMGEQVPQQGGPPAAAVEGRGGAGGSGGRGGEAGRGGDAARGRERGRPSVDPLAVAAPPSLSIDSAIALSVATMPAWHAISIALPQPNAKTLTASLDAGNGGQPQLRGSLVIDRSSGAVSRWEPFSSQTPGRRLRSILRFAHTGEVLGFTGQTIAGLVSLGAVILGWTGIALALRRLWSWRRRKTRVPAPARHVAEPEPELEAVG